MLLARATRNPIMASMMEALMEVMGEFIGRIGPSDNPFVLPSRRRLLRHLRARAIGCLAASALGVVVTLGIAAPATLLTLLRILGLLGGGVLVGLTGRSLLGLHHVVGFLGRCSLGVIALIAVLVLIALDALRQSD